MRLIPRSAVVLTALLVPPGLPTFAADHTISFTDEVAPILVSQCIVCHNARSAKGRFSVETYASLMKPGESGDAIIPGEADVSNLVLLVESGDMPKDGDPLPADQVAVLKRWINQGAKLDDGKRADLPLSSIMPKPAHPTPPQIYPTPVPVTALDFAPDGERLAVSGHHEVLVFDPTTGQLLQRIQNLPERIYAIAFNPDGERLAVAAGTPARIGEVKVLRASTGELIADLASAGDSFFDVAFSADGTKLVAAGADRSVRIWSVAEWSEQLRVEDHADWVTAVAFSPDGNRVATASRDGTAKVFDAATGESVVTFNGHGKPVLDVSFTPDGKRVVSCGKDGRVRIWNVSDAKEHKNSRAGGDVLTLADFNGDGFIYGTSGGKTRLLDFNAKEVRSFSDRPDWIEAIAVTSEAEAIAIGTQDGTIAVLRSETGEPINAFLALPPK